MADFVLNPIMYADAYRAGMTLSAYLEGLDPSAKYAAADLRILGGDAFERQLRLLDIRTKSIPEMGLASHTVERFYNDSDGRGEERKTLFPEWLARIYRRHSRVIPRESFNGGVNYVDGHQRLLATDSPLSDVLWPDAMDGAIRFQQLEPSLLSFLVGRTRTITSDTFKAFYLDDTTTEADARMVRVSEYSEIPAMRLVGSDQSIQAKKYGRRFQASYESIRRVSLDLISFAIAYIAAKADSDKFLTALDIIINGDGNAGTAATSTDGSTLDSGAAGALTLKMWLKWGMLWRKPHQANVVLGQDESVALLLLLQAGAANLPPQQLVTAQGALGAVTLARPIYGGMVAINDSSVTASNLLAIDSRYSVEMVSEAGADIVETQRVISAQFEEIVISEVVGFDIMTLGQNRLLAYTA